MIQPVSFLQHCKRAGRWQLLRLTTIGAMPGCSIYDVYIDIYNSYINGDREKAIEIHNFILSMLNHIRQNSRMYRYKQKKCKRIERSVKTSLNSLALHNARTFKSLSLRARCITGSFLFNQTISSCFQNTIDLPLHRMHRRVQARYM